MIAPRRQSPKAECPKKIYNCIYIYLFTIFYVPNSSDCWVSISAFGSGAPFLAGSENPNGTTLEPRNLLLDCKAR